MKMGIPSGFRKGTVSMGVPPPTPQQTERHHAPHCDPTILHAPGKCEYCDNYPDWQEYRKIAHIAFSGEPDEKGVKRVYPAARDSMTRLEDFVPGIAPCPSTWFREPETRDLWAGNTPSGNDR